jgi:Tfp pilus assembly protein PilN
MKTENRQKFLLIAAIAVVSLLVADKIIVGPLVSGWKERTVRIVELKRSIAQGKQILQREDTIRNRWDNMRTNTLPDDVSLAENQVLRAFDNWSRDSRISISGIKPQWKRTSDDYMTLECRADASGNIEALTRFLYNLEKDQLALKVEAVEISSRDNDGQQLTLALQVSGLLLNPLVQ